MPSTDRTLIAMERKFWQSMVDEDTDTALAMLSEPSLMVSAHGAMQFSHDQYRQMAEHGNMVIKSFEFSDMQVMHPSEDTAVLTYRVRQEVAHRGDGAKPVTLEMADSTVWVRKGGEWRCVMHTETECNEGQGKKPAVRKTAAGAH